MTRILVAGIGNIFRGDDAFGVEVVRRLAQRAWPEGVRIADFGIRGFDLASALVEGWDFAILVDAAPRGGAPGTLYVLEPELPTSHDPRSTMYDAPSTMFDGHSLDPVRVLALANSLGGPLPQVLVVGCEPAPLNVEQDLNTELSPPVRAAVEESVPLVQSLIDRLRCTDPRGTSLFTADQRSAATVSEGRCDHASHPLQTHPAPAG